MSLIQPQIPAYGPVPDYSPTNIYAIHQGKIRPYIQNPGVYRCPLDHGEIGREYVLNANERPRWHCEWFGECKCSGFSIANLWDLPPEIANLR